MKYIDVHCHPNLHELKGDAGVLGRMREVGVAGIVVGVDLESSREAVRLAGEHEHLWATIGLHPNYTSTHSFHEAEFEALVSHPKVVGVGECGVDYFRQPHHSDFVNHYGGAREKQFEELEKQLAFAGAHNLPLMVHCRPSKNSMDAYHDFLDFIEPKVKMGDVGRHPLRGNMHFFVGDLEVARRLWAIGFTTSFTGVLTFTRDYDAVVREAPLDMILTETDAPYAAPMPHRGKRNEPSFVPLVVGAIARIRGEAEEAVREAVMKNACRVFSLPSPDF